MKRERYVRLLIGVLVATAIIGGATLASQGSASAMIGGWMGLSPGAGTDSVTVNGDYQGSASLRGVFRGVYTDATAPSSVDLGQIDLGLHLEQWGNQVTGHVLLDRTIVFTREHTIMVTPVAVAGLSAPDAEPLDVGPYVRGTFDGSTLRLDSESFTMSLNERTITRQFNLVSSSVRDSGATIEGKYLETIWGYDQQPSTVVGVFSLQRPIYGGATPEPPRYPTYLPLIFRQ